MPIRSVETVRAWLGRVMVDRDGKKLGEISDIYLDRETNRPEWAVVHTGLFGMRSTFVPLEKASEVGDQVQVPYQRTQVKDAPNIEADGQLSEAEEAELYRHYGLDYDTVTADGGTAASQPASSAADDRPWAAPTGADELTGTPTGGQEEAQIEGALPVDVTGSGRPDPQGKVAVQGGVAVGEGVSRPFVYETPGPPEGSPNSSRRRQPGQVRLRRYLVTEVVTETESGQRHEVRVKSEPINDPDIDAVTAPAGQPGEPTRREPPKPDDNDWFREEGDPRH